MAPASHHFHFDPAAVAPILGGHPIDPAGAIRPAIACLASDTLMEADGGTVPIDSLLPGHSVWTWSNGLRTVLHRALFRLDPDLLQSRDDLQPYRLTAGAFGHGSPRRDLVLAGRHRLQIRTPFLKRNTRGPEVLVTVRRLFGLPGVTPLPANEQIDYIALLLDGPHGLSVSGLCCEAFPAGPDMLEELFGLPVAAQSTACHRAHDVYPAE